MGQYCIPNAILLTLFLGARGCANGLPFVTLHYYYNYMHNYSNYNYCLAEFRAGADKATRGQTTLEIKFRTARKTIHIHTHALAHIWLCELAYTYIINGIN